MLKVLEMLKKKLSNNVKNLMIIGVGSIGKRHFQSLAEFNGEANFFLVDPIFNKIKKNKIKDYLGIKSIDSSKKIFFYKNVDEWINQNVILDLCIIATNSDNRFLILKKIISRSIVKNIILEKFLFTKISDYNKALDICKVQTSSVFVNQWMCQSSKLRNILKKFRNFQLDFLVTGTEWGLASNILHFIDLVRFFKIKELVKPKIVKANLSPTIRPAKRKGFYEVYGSIKIKYGQHNLIIKCSEGNFATGSAPDGINVEIKARNFKNRFIKFKLKLGLIQGLENFDGNIHHFSVNIELMSQLTRNVFESLNTNKKIYLPTLKQSTEQHLVICKLFSKHFQKSMKIKSGICPVT
tara:strand:+ start:1754 stop:2812 length:1059 start_codon:yes stop_codon:yes gene_type:complete